MIFQIGESDSRWTVFFNEMMSPTYQTFTDKPKEPFKRSETEFGIKKNQWKQLTNRDALNLYKKTFKDDADQFGITITSTQI